MNVRRSGAGEKWRQGTGGRRVTAWMGQKKKNEKRSVVRKKKFTHSRVSLNIQYMKEPDGEGET